MKSRTKSINMNKNTRLTAIVFLLFNALSAMYGGGSLIYDPSGELLGMPIEFLEKSPFKSFLIPGIILFTVNGLFNLLVAILGIVKSKLFPDLTILCGVLLVGWLSVQIMIIKAFSLMAHGPYYLVGIILIFVGYKLRVEERQLNLHVQ